MFNQYIENGDNEHASLVSTDITSKTVGAPDLHTINEDGAKETASMTTATTAPPSADRSHVKFELPEDNDNIKTATIIRVKGGQYLQGFLLKKKRRKSGTKNFAKRFFVLNVKYGALDYYLNDKTNNIRGNMPIRQAIISADAKQRMFYLDSGMEQWVMKALNADDFEVWIQAFNFIKRNHKMIENAVGLQLEKNQHVTGQQLAEAEVYAHTSPIPLDAENSLSSSVHEEERSGRYSTGQFDKVESIISIHPTKF
ncbi:unnamed protein product [Ambrosiozyma monospora]|uniref:Unnamed protein product n=1 Tax=Ambrosiozyma monospora TaxID=43982 RepID=A0A9W6T236_AMBMO|nr:unnamed protein product [Ambrosiozyma monospora]